MTMRIPEKTITAYKMLQTKRSRPGELFPLFIGKSRPVPTGRWVEAERLPTPGYANRPGWHVGLLPTAPHLMSRDGSMQPGRVWAEVEIPADVDWQPAADNQRTRDLPDQVPVGGFYRFRRPASQGGEWLIAGAIRIKRILSDQQVAKILRG